MRGALARGGLLLQRARELDRGRLLPPQPVLVAPAAVAVDGVDGRDLLAQDGLEVGPQLFLCFCA